MAEAGTAVVESLARLVARAEERSKSDGRLLADFVGERDGRAFAELVGRFGPMVFAVCRRLTGHHQDAEDAFQATFAVLARKATAVTPREAVGAWLHGVAVRTAREARSMAAKRRACVTPVGSPPDVSRVDPEPDDDGAVLHEELAALPDKYRALLVMCDLDGTRQVEAARRLSVPVGTVYSRLATARRLLADRLRRRGVLLAATAVVGSLSQTARTAVPATLRAKAVAAATSPQSLPACVVALTNGVLRTMFVQKLKLVAPLAAVVAAGLLAAFAVGQGEKESPKSAPAKPPAAVREPVILVWRAGHAALLKPDGSIVREWKGDAVVEPGGVRMSPDGKTIAVLRPYETRTKKGLVDIGKGATVNSTYTRHLYRVTLYPVAEKLVGTDLAIPGDSAESVFWSGDGSKLYVSTHADEENGSHDVDLAHYVVFVATGKHIPLKLPAGHHVKDVSPDGKHFLTIAPPPDTRSLRPLYLVPDEGTPRRVTDKFEVCYDGRFSPDGKRLLLCGIRTTPAELKEEGGPRLPRLNARVDGWLETAAVDDPTGKRVRLPLRDNEYANCVRWSPDGKRAVTFRTVVPPLNAVNDPREVTVSDPDGRNAKAIFTDPERLVPVFLDWR